MAARPGGSGYKQHHSTGCPYVCGVSWGLGWFHHLSSVIFVAGCLVVTFETEASSCVGCSRSLPFPRESRGSTFQCCGTGGGSERATSVLGSFGALVTCAWVSPVLGLAVSSPFSHRS